MTIIKHNYVATWSCLFWGGYRSDDISRSFWRNISVIKLLSRFCPLKAGRKAVVCVGISNFGFPPCNLEPRSQVLWFTFSVWPNKSLLSVVWSRNRWRSGHWRQRWIFIYVLILSRSFGRFVSALAFASFALDKRCWWRCRGGELSCPRPLSQTLVLGADWPGMWTQDGTFAEKVRLRDLGTIQVVFNLSDKNKNQMK